VPKFNYNMSHISQRDVKYDIITMLAIDLAFEEKFCLQIVTFLSLYQIFFIIGTGTGI